MKKKKRSRRKKQRVDRFFDAYGRLEALLLDEAYKLTDSERVGLRRLHQRLEKHLHPHRCDLVAACLDYREF